MNQYLKPLAKMARKSKNETDFVAGAIWSYSISGQAMKALKSFNGKNTDDKLASFYKQVEKKK